MAFLKTNKCPKPPLSFWGFAWSERARAGILIQRAQDSFQYGSGHLGRRHARPHLIWVFQNTIRGQFLWKSKKALLIGTLLVVPIVVPAIGGMVTAENMLWEYGVRTKFDYD